MPASRQVRPLLGTVVVLALSGAGPASARGAPTRWNVDTHEHSSFSGDARQQGEVATVAAGNRR
jgi:hypothetical protein